LRAGGGHAGDLQEIPYNKVARECKEV